MYNNKLISPDCARVNVTWTHDDYEEEEIDIPTKENDSTSEVFLSVVSYGIRKTSSWTCRRLRALDVSPR
jgi:hypothetical protein